jgi:hypothetical protein
VTIGVEVMAKLPALEVTRVLACFAGFLVDPVCNAAPAGVQARHWSARGRKTTLKDRKQEIAEKSSHDCMLSVFRERRNFVAAVAGCWSQSWVDHGRELASSSWANICETELPHTYV